MKQAPPNDQERESLLDDKDSSKQTKSSPLYPAYLEDSGGHTESGIVDSV